MAGIAGVVDTDNHHLVEKMLKKISHRGNTSSKIINGNCSTLGAVWSQTGNGAKKTSLDGTAVWDASEPLHPDSRELANQHGPFAIAVDMEEGIFLARGVFGVRPLYYGYFDGGQLCFASEVKAILELTRDVKEFPIGSWYRQTSGFQTFGDIEAGSLLPYPADKIAKDLQIKLERAVRSRIGGDVAGSWLSGGLDSSIMVALARPHVRTLHTFAGGLKGAPDLIYARQVAKALDCEHHEVLLDKTDLVNALPDVIYHLESFDALLVRSTIVNYLVALEAANYTGEVFSGEGGDELFGGYAYLEEIPDQELPSELLDITRRLHNTALQRVDRSARAHGLSPHVPFLDPNVAFYGLRIPPELKRGNGSSQMEKWILRKAMEGRLPEDVLWRRKAKFWEGAGVGVILSQHVEKIISDHDFAAERKLPNGWLLNTKEELWYYRIFKEHFGEFDDLSWMGRTKGAPIQN
jgi:asparagine synthase (glutamine-hydrolysing)